MADKPGLAIVLAGLKKRSAAAKGEPDGDEAMGPPSADGDLQTAAADMISAIEAKDPQALAAALQSFLDMRG